ncbi:hypothetical protein DO021_21860 [Desulfobacter hydrogenophilus]|uniref:Uncharacterized protein n=1 Tax=Desulfobacter hydrogenophilus TaxID=2291 RepID=A0A328F6R5_9BACT|nr:hypothetical protein DO021_21860 [Desulfobacter hydrogenophilus]
MTKGLNGHHSPDLFHVMYEISRGTGAPLSAVIRKAEKEHEKNVKTVHDALKSKETFEYLDKRPVGKHPDFDKRISFCQKKRTRNKHLSGTGGTDPYVYFFN